MTTKEIPYGCGEFKRRIVCAANRHKDGAVILGIRHFDSVMHNTIDLRKEINPTEDWDGCDQGFVDQRGVYLTREEAWVIACCADQIIRLVGSQCKEDLDREGVKLYSENLY